MRVYDRSIRGRGMQAFGDVLIGIGRREIRKQEIARREEEQDLYDNDMATAKALYLSLSEKFLAEKMDNRNPANNLQEFDKQSSAMESNILKDIVSPDARIDMGNQLKVDMARLRGSIGEYSRKQEAKNIDINYEADRTDALKVRDYLDIDHFADDYLSTHNNIMNAHKSGKVARVFDEQQYENELRTQLISKANSYIMRNPDLIAGDKKYLKNPNLFLKENGLEVPGIDGPMYRAGDIADLNKDYRTQKNAIDRRMEKELKSTQYQNEVGLYLRMPQNDTEQKEPVTITELNKMLLVGDITLPQHESLSKQMTEEPEDIITDQRVLTELEKDALNVSNGSVPVEDMLESAGKARYEDKTIDDAAYHSVMSLANREHKTYQANAMGEAITYAGKQLLAEDEVLFAIASEADLEGDETIGKRIVSLGRLQQENYSQYKRALNEWFEAEKADGRDPDDDDIYVKSRKMAVHYRNRVLDESIYEDLLTKEELDAKEIGRFFVSRPAGPGKFKGGPPEQKQNILTRKAKEGEYPEGTIALGPGDQEIGVFDADSKLVLSENGIRLLKQMTGGNLELARKVIKEKGWIIPE